METRLTWDPSKARHNQRVHGISFEEAREVFADPNQFVSENYFVDEQRYQVIGLTRSLALLLVVFVFIPEADGETIRIISARKAVKHEQSLYNEQSR